MVLGEWTPKQKMEAKGKAKEGVSRFDTGPVSCKPVSDVKNAPNGSRFGNAPNGFKTDKKKGIETEKNGIETEKKKGRRKRPPYQRPSKQKSPEPDDRSVKGQLLNRIAAVAKRFSVGRTGLYELEFEIGRYRTLVSSTMNLVAAAEAGVEGIISKADEFKELHTHLCSAVSKNGIYTAQRIGMCIEVLLKSYEPAIVKSFHDSCKLAQEICSALKTSIRQYDHLFAEIAQSLAGLRDQQKEHKECWEELHTAQSMYEAYLYAHTELTDDEMLTKRVELEDFLNETHGVQHTKAIDELRACLRPSQQSLGELQAEMKGVLSSLEAVIDKSRSFYGDANFILALRSWENSNNFEKHTKEAVAGMQKYFGHGHEVNSLGIPSVHYSPAQAWGPAQARPLYVKKNPTYEQIVNYETAYRTAHDAYYGLQGLEAAAMKDWSEWSDYPRVVEVEDKGSFARAPPGLTTEDFKPRARGGETKDAENVDDYSLWLSEFYKDAWPQKNTDELNSYVGHVTGGQMVYQATSSPCTTGKVKAGPTSRWDEWEEAEVLKKISLGEVSTMCGDSLIGCDPLAQMNILSMVSNKSLLSMVSDKSLDEVEVETKEEVGKEINADGEEIFRFGGFSEAVQEEFRQLMMEEDLVSSERRNESREKGLHAV